MNKETFVKMAYEWLEKNSGMVKEDYEDLYGFYIAEFIVDGKTEYVYEYDYTNQGNIEDQTAELVRTGKAITLVNEWEITDFEEEDEVVKQSEKDKRIIELKEELKELENE